MAEKRIMGALKADRIMGLPGDVVDHILSFLPYRDAVRTSILSKKWRDKWLSIPRLNFDEELAWSLNDFQDIESIIYRALLLHTGSLLEFILVNPFTVSQHAMDSWLHFMSKHHIQVLSLGEVMEHYPFVMPRHFFNFDHLTHLHLSGVVIKPPLAFKGFNELVSLNLKSIQAKFGDFTRFLSKCPRLEFLKLRNCETSGHLYVDAPKLKCFKFRGNFSSIFINAIGIEELSVKYDALDKAANGTLESRGVEANLINAFGYFPYVTKIKFNYNVLKFMAMFSIPEKPPNLNSLTVIKLSGVQFGKTDFVSCALCLLRSSPNLQRLEIRGASPTSSTMEQEPAALQCLKAQQECEPLLPRLKIVVISFMSYAKSGMEFVRLILLWAITLEKLVFENSSCNSPSAEKASRMLRKLAGFRRASSHAEVICKLNKFADA